MSPEIRSFLSLLVVPTLLASGLWILVDFVKGNESGVLAGVQDLIYKGIMIGVPATLAGAYLWWRYGRTGRRP